MESYFESLDYNQLVLELVREIRGGKSQAWLNKRLGVQHNLSYRYESGYKKIYWDEFVTFTKVFKIDWQKIMPLELIMDLQPEAGIEIFKELQKDISQEVFLRKMDLKLNQLVKLNKGHSRISLESMLKAIQITRNGLLDFLECICDPKNLKIC